MPDNQEVQKLTTNIMATLSELYTYLEGKMDHSCIDSDFPLHSFPEAEREESRIELFTWWKIESIVEDENCPINKENTLAYLDKRIAATGNLFLIYRYSYFAYLLSNNRQYAEKATDALINSIKSLLPKKKEDYPFQAKDAIEILFFLSKRIRYRQKEIDVLFWDILDGNYGCRTKLVILENAKQTAFFSAKEAERVAEKCKQLLPLAPEHWNEKCCEIGLQYAVKLYDKGKPYVAIFNEALGDMHMSNLVDITSEPNNIALPHLNDNHLEKAMRYFMKADATSKMLKAQRQYSSNKKYLRYFHCVSSKETDKEVVAYFNLVNESLLSGRFSFLMWNLVMPVQFIFPSLKMIREYMTEVDRTTEYIGFSGSPAKFRV